MSSTSDIAKAAREVSLERTSLLRQVVKERLNIKKRVIKMTVKELKSFLNKLPDDAVVYYNGGEYNGDYRVVSSIAYRKEVSLGGPGNSIFIG